MNREVLELSKQLTFSEQQTWLDEFRKIDQAQADCTDTRFTHWFRNKARPMQRGQDFLYSSRKQSIWKCFLQEPGNPHWVDWESTSEFDTDCDYQADLITRNLQTRVTALQALQNQQLLGE